MRNRKWLCLLMAGLLALGMLASCSGGGESGKTTESGTDSATREPETSGSTDDGQEIALVTEGETQYRLVYPDNSGVMFQELATEIAKLVEDLTGAYMPVQKESFAQQTTKPTVYVGVCLATERAGLTKDLAYNAYRMTEKDGNLYLIASASNALTAAGNLFKKSIRSGKSGKNIALDFSERSSTVTSQAAKIPAYHADCTVYGYATGAQSYGMVFPGAKQTDFDAYLAQLTAEGYTEQERRSLPGVEYAAYGKGDDMLFVTLSCEELRVTYEPLSACWMDAAPAAAAEAVCQTTGYLMGVYGGGDFENGMAMFYLLSDGTFLVFDGGHNASDADNLYQHLRKIASENGIAEVRVSAWIITHFHGDHVGAFEPFLSKYSSMVKIDRAVFGATSSEQGSAATEGDSMVTKATSALKTYQPDCRVVRLHTGQLLTLGDMTMEVLYTPSDLSQGGLKDYNDASMVVRLKVGEKTILMTGDAATATWNLLVKKYGSYLKSDFLQVPHHGAAGGGTTAAYDLIDPDVLFWPAGNNLYQYELNEQNTAICGHLIAMVKPENIHIAGVNGTLTAFRFR